VEIDVSGLNLVPSWYAGLDRPRHCRRKGLHTTATPSATRHARMSWQLQQEELADRARTLRAKVNEQWQKCEQS
jgi:hypothetical protein